MKVAKAIILLPVVLAPACGSSSTSPSGPGSGPTPDPGFGVSGVVFYDENGNGMLDAGENVRLPGATVQIGGQTAQAGPEGSFTVAGVPAGSQTAQADPGGLPPYYAPGAAVSVSVPQAAGSALAVPAVLEIGGNRPNWYMAFGDSITSGDGGGQGGGYPPYLRADLRDYLGEAEIVNAGVPGTKSNQGETRLGQELAKNRPAFTLILYGTNDYNSAACRSAPPCYTVDALRSMILQARDSGSNPIIGTIPPVNPAYVDKGAVVRNSWVEQMNDFVRAMAQQEGVPIAEIHGDLMAQPGLRDLFADDKHPNDAGYQVVARSWWNAITSPAAVGAAARALRFGFQAPGVS